MSATMTPEIAEQIRDFRIAEMKNSTSAELFSPAGEVGEALEGGGFKVTKSQADKTTIYSTIDGTPSEVLVYMLSKKLQQKREDGLPAFSLEPQPRVVGELVCYLHPESEEREHLDAIGLRGRTCRKSNIPTQWDRDLHMQRKHKNEWTVVERARERQEREDQMRFARVQAEAMQRLAEQGAAPQKRGA